MTAMRLVLFALLALAGMEASADDKLTGTVIGTLECVDYSNTSKMTTSVNTSANAFDGNLNTFFATWERSYTWAGLDLGSPHVITRVGWSPRNDSQGEGRVVLGVFEGANSPDFMDALPLYLIDEKGKIGQFSYADVNCSRGFRYIYRSGGSCAGQMKTFVDNIVVKNADAKKQMLTIWDEARQSGLTEENLVAFIDQMEAELNQSQLLNFQRWKIMNTKVHQNPKLWGSYTAEVQNVRRFMKERLAWMDRKLQYTYVPNGVLDISVDLTLPYQVFTLSGQPCGTSLSVLPPGIYVVRQGAAAKKVAVR